MDPGHHLRRADLIGQATNATKMNEFLTEILTEIVDKGPDRVYKLFDGHFIPQSKFIDQAPRKVHLLRTETLADDLRCWCGRDIPLPRINSQSYPKGSRASLSQQNIQLIQTVYSEDFKMFGYDF